MPLQNRVDPWGNIRAVDARGTIMGNRGILHNEKKSIVARWRTKNWIACELEFRGRKREVFLPHRYSQLFFLDEATAFSAGHRPCAECRRARYNEFKAAWLEANRMQAGEGFVAARQMDIILHRERVTGEGEKVTFEAKLATLPDGTFIEKGNTAWLIWEEKLHCWSFWGYEHSRPFASFSEIIRVLTPESVVRTFSLGFRPKVHESVYISSHH